MCLVLIAFHVRRDWPLIVAANRDEFHSRPTQEASWWPDQPNIIAGRDLQAGGTWLGVHRNGRFATVTNFRGALPRRSTLRSRGHLVADFLLDDMDPMNYLQSVDGDAYAGFNLLVGDGSGLGYLSNRGGGIRELDAGIYGLSNATLDAPWDKVERSKARLNALFEQERVNEPQLLRLLSDREKGPVEEVRNHELGFALEHALTAPFIVTPDYGTRCSTVVSADGAGRWRFIERRFDAGGTNVGESRFSFRIGEHVK